VLVEKVVLFFESAAEGFHILRCFWRCNGTLCHSRLLPGEGEVSGGAEMGGKAEGGTAWRLPSLLFLSLPWMTESDCASYLASMSLQIVLLMDTCGGKAGRYEVHGYHE